jgi:signal transduction histidine kinase
VTTLLPFALVLSAAMALWVATMVRRRPAVPGGGPFLWLLVAIVDGDPTQIRQVVMNLIINAADAVEEGCGEIGVTTGVTPIPMPPRRRS